MRPPSARMGCRWGRREEARRRQALGAADLCAKWAAAVNAGEALRLEGDEERWKERKGGGEGRRAALDPVAEAKCACHVGVSPPSIPVTLPSPPSPFAKEDGPRPHPLRAAPIARRQGHPSPLPGPFLLISTKGTRMGCPKHLPFPLFGRAAVYARDRGAQGHTTPGPTLPIAWKGRAAPAPYCATLYARERGSQGHATPDATLPIRAEGAHTRGTSPPAPPLRPRGPVQERGSEGHATPVPTLPFPFARKGRARGA
ncbi:hypothetical protein EDB86DRAFT_3091037 [Lactarius hatsudake]|nr:hypothetical protein EDB86DRAFT_3091037 [Lactarius hatsudake]